MEQEKPPLSEATIKARALCPDWMNPMAHAHYLDVLKELTQLRSRITELEKERDKQAALAQCYRHELERIQQVVSEVDSDIIGELLESTKEPNVQP